METLGARITEIRENLDLRLTQLADLAGVDHGTLSRIESGRILNPRVATLLKLATALNTSVDYLLAGNVRGIENDPDVIFLSQELKLLDKEGRRLSRALIQTLRRMASTTDEEGQDEREI